MTTISDATKVPLSWVLACAVAVSGIVIYVVDIRTQVAIVQAQSASTADRVTALESQWREDLQMIRSELSKINDRLSNKTGKRGD